MFALTKKSGFGFFGHENDRSKHRTFVLAIAKWLTFRASAGAKGIFFALFQFDLLGACISNFGFIHIDNLQLLCRLSMPRPHCE
jgi:hypothetical protein